MKNIRVDLKDLFKERLRDGLHELTKDIDPKFQALGMWTRVREASREVRMPVKFALEETFGEPPIG